MIEPLRAETNFLVLSNLGNPAFNTTTQLYTIYGMPLHSIALSGAIEIAFDYVTELLGAIALTDPLNYNKIKLFMSDFATLRVLGTLQGQVITKHFNYSSGGLNIQKPAVGQMATMVEHYTRQCSLWRKMLLTRAHVDTGPNNLEIAIPNEKIAGSGIMTINYDSASV